MTPQQRKDAALVEFARAYRAVEGEVRSARRLFGDRVEDAVAVGVTPDRVAAELGLTSPSWVWDVLARRRAGRGGRAWPAPVGVTPEAALRRVVAAHAARVAAEDTAPERRAAAVDLLEAALAVGALMDEAAAVVGLRSRWLYALRAQHRASAAA